MTEQEAVRTMEQLLREEAKRPPEEQLRDLIEKGVIDKKGRVLIGNNFHVAAKRKETQSSNGSRNGKPAHGRTRGTKAVGKGKKR